MATAIGSPVGTGTQPGYGYVPGGNSTSTGALTPIYGANGLIVGYGGGGGSAGAQTPITNASGLITGYNVSGADKTSSTVNASDPTGSHTFDPVTGLNAQGLTKGQQAALDYQNTTSTVSNTKSQPVQSAVDTTLNNETQLQATTLQNFNDYLAQAEKTQQQEQAQLTQDQTTVNALPGQLQSELSSAVQNFANTGNALNQDVTNLNTAQAATVAGDISQLGTINQNYATAAQNVANNAVAAAQARSNASQSATGVPTTDSGYWDTQAAKISADINLPVQQQIYNQQQQQLQNYITPQQQQLYSQNLSQITGLEMPLAQSLVSLGITNTNQIAQLQQNLLGKSFEEQVQFLNSLGIPIQTAQQLAQSLPSAIGQLSAINQGNNFYGLAQNYQSPLPGGLPTYSTPTPAYRSGAGGIPNYSTVTAGATPLPTTVGNPGTTYTNSIPAPDTTALPANITAALAASQPGTVGNGLPYSISGATYGADTSGLVSPDLSY
jgi:hypothetical protein